MSTQPRYLKINGTWYVSKQHMAEQMERVLVNAALDQIDRYAIKVAVPPIEIDMKPGAVNAVIA